VELLRQTYDTRHDLVRLRRIVAPLRDVLSVFGRREEHIFGGNLDDYFRDLWDHVVTVYDEIDAGRDSLAAALEGHMSVISNRLNEVVLRVSAWAAIIAVPTFIASVYGMNFDNMPELHWVFGYPLIVAVMLAVGGFLYWAFHRRGWL
jgi:magnesium transporter